MIKPKTNSIILLCKNYDNKLEEIEFTNQDIKDIIYNLNLNSNDDVTNYIISIGMTESSIPIFLTKQQLWNYITEKQKINPEFTARCELTEYFKDIPKGKPLEFGVYKKDWISTYDEDTFDRNKKFGYDFNYQWDEFWDDYKGKFILIDDDSPQQGSGQLGGVTSEKIPENPRSISADTNNQVEVLEEEYKCEDIVRHGLKLFPNLTREEFFNLKFKLVEPTRIKWDNRIWREEK